MTRTPYARLLHSAFAMVLSCVFLLGPNSPANTAVRDGLDATDHQSIEQQTKLIKRIQRGLAKLGSYLGPIDGILGPATRAAIIVFQKGRGMKPDGVASDTLATSIETDTKVSDLLKRLEDAREETMASARDRLLADPRTRYLIEKSTTDQVADPTRDATPCFRAPSPQCLLVEAVESAKAIFKPELRDWAFGEILAQQARAGLADKALATARRISDPRLIVLALRSIAEARAQAGAIDEAIDAAQIIPDDTKRLDAYIRIAEIQLATKEFTAAVKTVDLIERDLEAITKKAHLATYRARAAVFLEKAGRHERASQLVKTAETIARTVVDAVEREVALRHVAVALAETGAPQQAHALTIDTATNQNSTHIQIAMATAYARKGDSKSAMATAASIEKERYRALAYSKVATELVGRSKADSQTALKRAQDDAAVIKLPFAGAYAVSRTVLAALEVAPKSSTEATYDVIIDAAEKVRDPSLKAYTLWALAAELRQRRMPTAAETAATLAKEATRAVKSQLSQAWIYGDQVEERVADGQGDEAWRAFNDGLAIAKKINNPWGRARALGKMAGALSILIENSAAQERTPLTRPTGTVPQQPIPNGHVPTLPPR